MAILNITYNGLSADYPVPLDDKIADRDVRRIAVELVRSGGVPGLQIANLSERAFDNYVIDRFGSRGHAGSGQRIYLRPKVPFGAGARR